MMLAQDATMYSITTWVDSRLGLVQASIHINPRLNGYLSSLTSRITSSGTYISVNHKELAKSDRYVTLAKHRADPLKM